MGISPDKQHPHSHDTGFDADAASSTLLQRPENAFNFMAVGQSGFYICTVAELFKIKYLKQAHK